jgi:hypothetical protein
MTTEPTLQDVIDTIHDFAANVDERFSHVESDISGIKGEIAGMKGEISGMRSQMVTKDYLDEKIAQVRGDLVVTIRKEDAKVDALASTLHAKNLLSGPELAAINAQGPFPRL